MRRVLLVVLTVAGVVTLPAAQAGEPVAASTYNASTFGCTGTKVAPFIGEEPGFRTVVDQLWECHTVQELPTPPGEPGWATAEHAALDDRTVTLAAEAGDGNHTMGRRARARGAIYSISPELPAADRVDITATVTFGEVVASGTNPSGIPVHAQPYAGAADDYGHASLRVNAFGPDCRGAELQVTGAITIDGPAAAGSRVFEGSVACSDGRRLDPGVAGVRLELDATVGSFSERSQAAAGSARLDAVTFQVVA